MVYVVVILFKVTCSIHCCPYLLKYFFRKLHSLWDDSKILKRIGTIMQLRGVWINQSKVWVWYKRTFSAKFKVWERFVNTQKLRDLFCKLLENHHWSCSIFFSPDPEHDDDGARLWKRWLSWTWQDEGVKHCGEEMTWTRDRTSTSLEWWSRTPPLL